ncbi:TPA: molecular chaperone [Escherichia coli]|nr:molecular chaperone [Escherichia coli]HAZ3493859.1 molecular chaperone [Escherichia coli]HAZ3563063.1 molecular chaperone [Escherichia coli]HAZ3567841.1 molecular chaperone [Escherichia coli]HAZ3661908.1 molecular chaperone [Escherichia coli]
MRIISRIFYTFLFLISILFYGSSYASVNEGLGLDVTRVIFNSSKQSVSLRANNTSGKDIWLLRSWITGYYNEDNKSPFFITPPIIRMNENESIQLRINKLSDIESLPTDRESVFSINVMGIPPEDKSNSGGSIKIAINTKIKLFYRPESINDKQRILNIHNEIKLKKINDKIEIENPTPYFVTLDKIKVNNKLIKDGDYMISPFSKIKIDAKSAHVFTYQIINDFGGWSNPVSISL